MLSVAWRRPRGTPAWGGDTRDRVASSHLDGSSSTEKAPFMWMELRLFSNMP